MGDVGKIIIRHVKKELHGFFSPACCFDENERISGKLEYYPIKTGLNFVKCNKCGKKYRIFVKGRVDDFKNIDKEELTGKFLTVKFHVDWDFDEEDKAVLAVTLPDADFTAFVPVPEEDDFDIEDYLSDWLSDEYGFCHNGFSYEISIEGEEE